MVRSQPQRRARAGLRARPLSRSAYSLAESTQLPETEVLDLASLGEVAARAPLTFEPLLAGTRVLVARQGGSVAVLSEARRSMTRELPSLVGALAGAATMPDVFVAEGMLVAMDPSGRPSFEALRSALTAGSERGVLLILCDVFRIGDVELAKEPLEVRRRALTSWTLLPTGVTVMTTLGSELEVARRAMAEVRLDGLVGRGVGPSAVRFVATQGPAEPVGRRSLSAAPRVTNPTKVLFPRDGLTKQHLVDYYTDVAPLLLPLMSQRPLVLQRWPDGIDEFMWYQHRVPPRAPDYVRVIPVEGNRRIGMDGVDALLWMVNQAAITFHGFASREGSLEHPDWLLLDLDPPEDGAWPRVVKVALAVRKMLELFEVESVLKTSGQKGLHIVVPLASGQRAAEVKRAARRICELLAALLPEDTTLETEREKRQGRVFLDANQGYVGKTLVLPYSVRGVDGAPVSTPLRWNELSTAVPPSSFTTRTMRARLDRVGDLATALRAGSVQVGRLLERLPAAPRTSG